MTATSETIDELLDLVRQQQSFLAMFVRSWADDYCSGAGTIFCGKGCRNCCSLAVHTGFVEALAIARTLNESQAKTIETYALRLRNLVQGERELPEYLRLHRQEMGFCPLLSDTGECSVYAVRPLSCRSLISTREPKWCGMDFSKLTLGERNEFVAGLDRQVVAFPSHYVAVLQESGKELEEAGAKAMRARFGLALYGNLGVLLHLIRSHGLCDALLQGPAEVAGVIAEAGFDHPLLLQLTAE